MELIYTKYIKHLREAHQKLDDSEFRQNIRRIFSRLHIYRNRSNFEQLKQKALVDFFLFLERFYHTDRKFVKDAKWIAKEIVNQEIK